MEPGAEAAKMDAETLRKERNKIACRKSRQKRGQRLRDLEADTKKLEEQHAFLLQRLQEVSTESRPPQQDWDSSLSDIRTRRRRILHEIIAAIQDHNFGPVYNHFHPECITIKDKCVQHKGPEEFFHIWSHLHEVYDAIKFTVRNIHETDPHCDQMRVQWGFSGIVTEKTIGEMQRGLGLVQVQKMKAALGKSVQLCGESYFVFNADRIVFVNLMWGDSVVQGAVAELAAQSTLRHTLNI